MPAQRRRVELVHHLLARARRRRAKDLRFSKQMTNLRVPLQRSDDRTQQQNPCDTKRLLSLLMTRATNIPCGVQLLSSATTEQAAGAGISRKFYANVR